MSNAKFKVKAWVRWALIEANGNLRVVARPNETKAAFKLWAAKDERIIRVEIREIRAAGKRKGKRP